MAEAKQQNFMYGAAILAAGVVVMKILGAIYKIPLQNILGDTGYGYFFAAYSIYNVLLTISTAGLPVALSRMISEANTLSRPRQARRTFRIATVTLGIIGVVFSLAMFLFPTEMAVFFVSKPEVSQCVSALAPAVLLVCLTSAFRGYIQGRGNMAPTTVGQVIEVLVKVVVGLALAVWMTRAGKPLPESSAGAIFGVTAGSLAALLYMLWAYLRLYRADSIRACRLSPDREDPVGATLGRFVKIGVVITLGASVMSVISLVDTKLIEMQLPGVVHENFAAVAAMYGLRDLPASMDGAALAASATALSDELYGSYAAMQTLYNLPASFVTPMTISVVPAIAAAMAVGSRREAGTIAESGLRISAVVAMPMGIGLAVLSRPIVRVLYPTTHAVGPLLLAILGPASIFVCVALVTNAILQAQGDEKLPIFSMLAGGVVKIGANLLLVSRPEINILGAAIGTVACYAVICVMNCVFIRRRMKGAEAELRYGRVFLRPLVSALVMGAAAWASYGLLSLLFHVDTAGSRLPMLIALAGAIVIAVIVYLVMAVVTRSVTAADMKLIPKGEKIARLLHIR